MSIPLHNLANHLLIALPTLHDGPFARSVTLICHHDAHGAMGIVVNQPSNFMLGEILAQMSISPCDERLMTTPVLHGGPVHTERGFVIHDDHRPWSSTRAIGEDLFLTTSRDILRAMADGTGPDNALVVLGCAGWEAGQLETELSQDVWLTSLADTQLLFDTPYDERWLGAAAHMGVDLFHLASYSGHA